MPKPRVLYVCTEAHTERVFPPETYAALQERYDLTENLTGEGYSTAQVEELIPGHEALITGWGAPALNEAVLKAAPELRIIAHSAGSVKHLVTREIIDRYLLPRGIPIYSANWAIALNVAESTVGLLIMTPRRWAGLNERYHATGQWGYHRIEVNGQFLQGSVVGIVSASTVAREVIRLLQPWDVRLLCYDPYLSEADAAALGVEKVELDELFRRSDHVTVHAPKIPETDRMIGAEQLRLLRAGATLVNTSRGSVIDEAALIAEARAGRIEVALDVTEPEPPAPDSPLQELENVVVLPHVTGAGQYGYHRIGDGTLQALDDFFAGRPVRGAVDYARWEQLA